MADVELDEEEQEAEGLPSIPDIPELESQFFEIVENGNVSELQLFLEANPDFNINALNIQNITALHIAVRERDLAMVEFLLSLPDVEPQDTHLHAIQDNQLRIAVMILDKLGELGLEFELPLGSTDFPIYATPLSVAAQHGYYEIIALLRRRDHNLVKPHPPYCNCEEECKPEREREDLLTLNKKRLFMYEAVSNPVYICYKYKEDLMSERKDPILVAFELSIELENAASFDREFYYSYKRLAQQVSQLATDLIGCARTNKEVELVLKQTSGFARSAKFAFPRLLLALDYKQKSFVAHSNVQQLVENVWIGNWYEWKIRNVCLKMLSVIPRIFILPVIALVVLFVPNSKLAKFWQSPVNKFLSSMASYLVFLVIVFIESNFDKTEQFRGPPNTGVEPFLAIYVLSYLWQSTRLCIVHGPKRFFRTPWNWYEVTMLSLFVLTFLFWITAAIDVRVNGQRELERKYWHKHDPTLIAEGIFCIATIMAFFRLMFICQLDYHLGPLQLSLGKMIIDVGKFITLFSIIIFAFSAGLCRLYQYYKEMVQIDDESKIKIQQVNSFVDFTSSLKTLFWAVFCMSPIESADIVIENLPGESETETFINHHSFTESIGYIAFAAFEFISVIVVLNMLIACMSNTFTHITENVIVEWTFGRTEVSTRLLQGHIKKIAVQLPIHVPQAYVDFMLTTTLPPPFNIIPTLEGVKAVVEYIKVLVKPPATKRARWDFKHCCYIENLEKKDDEEFTILMEQLVQRYLRKDKETVDSDIEGLKKELVELRNLLRDALSPA